MALNTGGNGLNWHISDSIIQDNYADGVFLAGGRGHVLEGTVIRRNGANGIDINSAANRIRNNWVYDNGGNFSAIDCFGILITAIGQSVDDNIVAGNKVYRNHCQGVIVRADETPYTASGTIIVNNDVWWSGGYGISLDTSVGPKCGTANKTLIVANHVNANAAGGILIGGGSGFPCTVDGSFIFANRTLNNGSFGIQVSYGSRAMVLNNVSNGNALGDASFTGSAETVSSGNILGVQRSNSSALDK
jgi:hypothetical protein